LVKLVVAEPESKETWSYAKHVQWVSSELAVTEVRRAVRGKVDRDPTLDLVALLSKAEIVLQETALEPLNRLALWRAGGFFDPRLGSHDAIHVMVALDLRPIYAFVTYDIHQAEVARDAGLNVRMPGA
jgi:predicted nucleic acid-binding protein